MAIVIPNAASTLGSAACIPGSEKKFVWLGLQTLTASGSVTWYQTSTSTSGSELIAFSLSPQQTVLVGPFNSPCGVYAAGVTGGCALFQMKR